MPSELQTRVADKISREAFVDAIERWALVREEIEARYPTRPSLVDRARLAMLVALDTGSPPAVAAGFARFAVGLPSAPPSADRPGSSIWRLAP